MFKDILLLLMSFFDKKQGVIVDNNDGIDWSNPNARISKYFTVNEATYLPSWGISHIPSEQEKIEIVKLAKIMDIIRERLGKPIVVHCWIRPVSVNCPGHEKHGQNYNLFVGSKSRRSGHIFGKAIDFHVTGETDFPALRKKIEPWLKPLGIRMEDNQGNWVHIDTLPVGYKRFFKP